MQTRLAVLADYASIAVGDKLNVLGIFSNILSPAAPVVHAQMYLVVQFAFDSDEAGSHPVQVVLLDEDGHELIGIRGEITVAPVRSGEAATVNQIFVFNNTSFPRFGSYEFQIALDGETRAIVPVNITQVSPPQNPG